MNPYLTEAQKENYKIDDSITALVAKFPTHIDQIKVIGEAWKNAAEGVRAYKQRMTDIAIGEAEAGVQVSAFGWAASKNRSTLQVNSRMITPGSGQAENPADVWARFDSINQQYMSPMERMQGHRNANLDELARLDPRVIGDQKIADLRLKIDDSYQKQIQAMEYQANQQRCTASSTIC